MTKQEADRIIADNYPKIQIKYLGLIEQLEMHEYLVGQTLIVMIDEFGDIKEYFSV